MSLLALETSTSNGSVVMLDDGGAVLFEESFQGIRTHSAVLFGVLQQALAAQPRPGVIAVGLGPGSYAGVRVAIAAAIGLRLALGAELRGVPSICALPVDAPAYRVIGDARRESFYLAEIADGKLTRPPQLWPMHEINCHLSPAEPLFATEPFSQAPQIQVLAPSALRVAQLALAPDFDGPRENLEPIYLRDPHITKARKKPLHP